MNNWEIKVNINKHGINSPNKFISNSNDSRFERLTSTLKSKIKGINNIFPLAFTIDLAEGKKGGKERMLLVKRLTKSSNSGKRIQRYLLILSLR